MLKDFVFIFRLLLSSSSELPDNIYNVVTQDEAHQLSDDSCYQKGDKMEEERKSYKSYSLTKEAETMRLSFQSITRNNTERLERLLSQQEKKIGDHQLNCLKIARTDNA